MRFQLQRRRQSPPAPFGGTCTHKGLLLCMNDDVIERPISIWTCRLTWCRPGGATGSRAAAAEPLLWVSTRNKRRPGPENNKLCFNAAD
ncbi:hypothetical protein EYF80_035450 [Liparis tanakae]|uniref:Uncharacterized protein n=1 Tax=Liparis tanakae TaxID=230148 RepID=A0A4Z2GMC4_9TELE|nr:hypothetical protein EYF80_035450 [Liparis tanakae]